LLQDSLLLTDLHVVDLLGFQVNNQEHLAVLVQAHTLVLGISQSKVSQRYLLAVSEPIEFHSEVRVSEGLNDGLVDVDFQNIGLQGLLLLQNLS